MKSYLALLTSLLLIAPLAFAAELLKPNDLIAFVGGEDMVAAAEQGQLELALVREFPDYHLKFRSLAWEGDTVYEQPRDLNYPSLEQQLDDLGATVVFAQFGLMESLAAPKEAAKFSAAYEKLVDRLSAGGKRRMVLLSPVISGEMVPARQEPLRAYAAVIKEVAEKRHVAFVDLGIGAGFKIESFRDGIHLSEAGQRKLALCVTETIGKPTPPDLQPSTDEFHLADAIRSKNRMWFHYARPQNWAFLNGDRTNQPSSRDYRDPSKRWFPEEMKEWLPLIAAKEESIWKLAHEMSAH